MSRTDEEGFSCIEAVCALLILSLLAGTALSAGRAVLRGMESAMETVAEMRGFLAVDSELRRCASRVSAPYWLPGPEVGTGAGLRLRVNRVDGLPGCFADFSIDGTLLSITIAGERRPLQRLPSAGSLRMTVEGLELSMTLHGKPVAINARWSGRSLYNAGE
jgi:hypothetical protein